MRVVAPWLFLVIIVLTTYTNTSYLRAVSPETISVCAHFIFIDFLNSCVFLFNRPEYRIPLEETSLGEADT